MHRFMRSAFADHRVPVIGESRSTGQAHFFLPAFFAVFFFAAFLVAFFAAFFLAAMVGSLALVTLLGSE